MEHWEYLKPDGLRFVWDDTLFRPGTDSFLLSSLPKLSAGLRVCDLGCGTGLVGLLLLQRQSELTVTGIDIQPAAVALAERAAAENRLTDRLTFRCIDLRQVRQHFSTGSFDLVVCNPPYYPPASGKVSGDSARRTLRNGGESDGYLHRRVLSAAVGRKILSGPQARTADGHSLRSAGGGHGTQAAALRPEPTGHGPFPLFDRGLPGR